MSMAQLWNPTPHGQLVPAATTGSSRSSQSGSPAPPPSSPSPPPLETAAVSAPPADPPIGASAMGCGTEKSSVNAVDNAKVAILAPPPPGGNDRRQGRRLQDGTVNAAGMPPSTGKAAPVTKPASSLARYATVPASSASVPKRPMG
jgi:hypothetical protein